MHTQDYKQAKHARCAIHKREEPRREREKEREPFARKPVAPMIKIVLFSKNGSIPSDSMREAMRKGEGR